MIVSSGSCFFDDANDAGGGGSGSGSGVAMVMLAG